VQQGAWPCSCWGLVHGLGVGADYAIGSPCVGVRATARGAGSSLEPFRSPGNVRIRRRVRRLGFGQPRPTRSVALGVASGLACRPSNLTDSPGRPAGVSRGAGWLSKGPRDEGRRGSASVWLVAGVGDFPSPRPGSGRRWRALRPRAKLRGRTVVRLHFWACLGAPLLPISSYRPTCLKGTRRSEPVFKPRVPAPIVALAVLVVGVAAVGRGRIGARCSCSRSADGRRPPPSSPSEHVLASRFQ